MTTPQQDGSFGFVSPDAVRVQKALLDLPMQTTCGCGWSFYGPGAEGIRLVKQHRTEQHPELGAGPSVKERKAAAKAAPKESWGGWME